MSFIDSFYLICSRFVDIFNFVLIEDKYSPAISTKEIKLVEYNKLQKTFRVLKWNKMLVYLETADTIKWAENEFIRSTFYNQTDNNKKFHFFLTTEGW